MSDDNIIISDPSWGEFIVSSNSHFDKDAGLWLKPWTNRPDRNDIGFIVYKHPEDVIVGYIYQLPDPMTGRITWYAGPHGNPDEDMVLSVLDYRAAFGG